MDTINSWKILRKLKSEIVSKINNIIVFGEKGTEVIFSTSDGKVYGFGNNSFGELGFGHKNTVKEPQNIVELNDKQVIDFSFGFRHVLAQTKTGKLYSWGDNSDGHLGIGTNTSDYRPKLIHSLSDKCVIAMSCGYNHTFVLTDDNLLYGFGYNGDGRIGCGNTNNQLKPIIINGFNNEILVSITCSGSHSLALTQKFNVYSWGNNSWGQLGIGNKPHTYIPTKIVVSNGLLFKQIVCGRRHSLLLSECGDVYAFGFNEFGSLGTGNKTDSYIPIKIEAIHKVKEISSHSLLNISMAKLEDNTCLVWGQCLTGNILKPMQTQFTSFNDVIGNHSMSKITVKSIKYKCIKKINRSWNKIIESFDEQYLSDISFKVGNKQIFVNKLILRLHSTHFENKYSVKSTEMRESSTDSVDDTDDIEVINNYSYEVFYSYLKYIYTDCVEIENQYLDQLLILSINYKEEDLKCNILDTIKSITNIENVCNFYEVSIKYGLTELENNCLEFIKVLKEKKLILKTDSYKNMSNDMKVIIFEKLLD